jgi:hypothetical protein
MNIRTPPTVRQSPLRGAVSLEVDLRPTIQIPIYKHETKPKRSKKKQPIIQSMKSDTREGNFAFHADRR